MGTEIRITQAAQLAPSDAFDAWIDTDRLAEWWWPHLPDVTYATDPRVGGEYRIWCEPIGIGAHGDYTRVDRPGRLEFTWVWDGDGGHPPDPVTVTITADGAGSSIELVHDCSADSDGVADLTQGWTDVLSRLGELGGS